MKVNFNKPITDFRGEPLRLPAQGNSSAGIVVTARDVICNVLSNVVNASKDDKLAISLLIGRIWNSQGEIDVTPEESVLIRSHLSGLPVVMFSTIYKMLE